MEVAIENITSLAATGNLAVNQLIERKAATTITAKVAFTEEPKWTTMMAKNVPQVVSRTVETLANTHKQKKRKLNLCFTGFQAKESETGKELV